MMSALIELRGLSRINTKICSSFSRLMKLPNQDFLASSGLDSGVRLDMSSDVGTCSLRLWKRGDPSRLFLKELSLVLQWPEPEAPILPPGLEGGVSVNVAPPPPSALEEEDEEEEEGVLGCSVCTGVPRGVGRGEPCGVTWEMGEGVAQELEGEFLDLKTEGEGKLKKRGMGDRSGEGEGDGGLCRGSDFIEWS